jgi:Lon protease-like protein
MTLSEKIQIPLFPLSILLLPGERTQLHIFEKRYQQLFAELEKGDPHFGIPFAMGGKTMKYGTRCKLVRVIKRYHSGESDILIEAQGIFELTEFTSMKEGKLYPFGTVILKRDLSKELASKEVLDAYEGLDAILSGSDVPLHLVDSPYVLAIMASLGFSSEEKFRFIQLESPERRNDTLLGLVNMMRQLISQEQATENGIYLS